ncbi:hypothetical protein [Planctomycetes bacterium TBK1r]|uniref:Uncharacterized protein n=1 Tax=Stieleria magnilauensis TaxID=2527963 RepID=A0ABX5XQ07_9BACT|nr:hypothetical protein TBK1r_23750 [Planctomycetes bacterium TBK1r]
MMSEEPERLIDEKDGKPAAGQHHDPTLQRAQRNARRGKRLTGLLAAITALTWIAAGATAVWTTDLCLKVAFHGFHGPMTDYQNLHNELMDQFGKNGRLSSSDVPADLWKEYNQRRRILSDQHLAMETSITATIVLFVVAALLSVLLIITSRRSTLSQVAASVRSIELILQDPSSAPQSDSLAD